MQVSRFISAFGVEQIRFKSIPVLVPKESVIIDNLRMLLGVKVPVLLIDKAKLNPWAKTETIHRHRVGLVMSSLASMGYAPVLNGHVSVIQRYDIGFHSDGQNNTTDGSVDLTVHTSNADSIGTFVDSAVEFRKNYPCKELGRLLDHGYYDPDLIEGDFYGDVIKANQTSVFRSIAPYPTLHEYESTGSNRTYFNTGILVPY
jgi:hypothetical protein